MPSADPLRHAGSTICRKYLVSSAALVEAQMACYQPSAMPRQAQNCQIHGAQQTTALGCRICTTIMTRTCRRGNPLASRFLDEKKDFCDNENAAFSAALTCGNRYPVSMRSKAGRRLAF